MGKYQLISNLKLIESGKIPTSDNLKPGEAAFGILDDERCHMFGNVGKTLDGPIVDISEESIKKVESTSIVISGYNNKFIAWHSKNKIELKEKTEDVEYETLRITPAEPYEYDESLIRGKHIYLTDHPDYYLTVNSYSENDNSVNVAAFYSKNSPLLSNVWTICALIDDNVVEFDSLGDIPEDTNCFIVSFDFSGNNYRWIILSPTLYKNRLEVLYINKDSSTSTLSKAIKKFINDDSYDYAVYEWSFKKGKSVLTDRFADKQVVDKIAKLGKGDGSLILNNAISADGDNSIAAGLGTEASYPSQLVIGKYNELSANPFIIGHGSLKSRPKNILEVNNQGKVISGSTDCTTDADVVVYSKKAKTAGYEDGKISLSDLKEEVEGIWYGDKTDVIYSKYPTPFDYDDGNNLYCSLYLYPFTKPGTYTFKIKNVTSTFDIKDISLYPQDSPWEEYVGGDLKLHLDWQPTNNKLTVTSNSSAFTTAGNYYLGISVTYPKQIDSKYLPIPDISEKMDKTNPTGTGSFSLNRKSGSYIGGASHAEGNSTTASGFASHAEGTSTIASGSASHAEGSSTAASGSASHAEGIGTKALGSNSHVQGKYNIEDSSNTYADIIGNGSDLKSRSNAATVDWSGNAWYAGDVYVGSTSGVNKDEGSKKLATEEYVDNSVIVPAPSSADNSKVLRVVDGKATWVSLPSASGVSF